MAGSHIDIIPTLIELAAPKGHNYHALGHNLLDSGLTHPVGLGVGAAVTPDAVYEVNPASEADIVDSYNALHGIAWWRIMRGPDI